MNRSSLMPLISSLVGLAGLLAACGGSAESISPTTSEPTPVAAPTITAADLPDLVLDVEEVSVDGTILPYDAEESGPKSESYYTENVLDADWWLQMMETYHWQGAYFQDFREAHQTSPVFDASIEIEIYGSPENAAGALAARFDWIATWVGRTDEGLTVQSVDIFDVDEFGGKGATVRILSSSGVSYIMTNIDFAIGSLVVDIGTATLDDRDLVPATLELVRLEYARLVEAGLSQSPT